jgi:hypothetical protein
MESVGIGRFLMALGALLLIVGAWISFGPRVPWLGRLPGDFSFGGPGGRFYFPLATCLLLSLVLTLLLRLFRGR